MMHVVLICAARRIWCKLAVRCVVALAGGECVRCQPAMLLFSFALFLSLSIARALALALFSFLFLSVSLSASLTHTHKSDLWFVDYMRSTWGTPLQVPRQQQ